MSSKKTEYITAGGTTYPAGMIQTMPGNISFALPDQNIAEAIKVFKPVTDLSVSASEDGSEPYGIYSNLSLTSVTVDAAGTVTVNMALADDTAVRLSGLEKTQAEQDEVLASLLFGGGEEDE